MFTVSIETYESSNCTLYFTIKKIIMGIIKLKNIRTYSLPRLLDRGRKNCSDYTINLEVKTDLRKSSISDDLKIRWIMCF
jgi:hypothetical protein